MTWTLKYPRCHWIEVLGLEEHYRRAEVRARLPRDGEVEIDSLQNVTRFAVLPPALDGPAPRLKVLGHEVPLPSHSEGEGALSVVVARRNPLRSPRTPPAPQSISDSLTNGMPVSRPPR